MRLSFTGDLMCELPYCRLYKKEKTDFGIFYQNIKHLWENSDYLIANLETPLAGEKAGYTTTPFCFNTPEPFAIAAKENGVNFVTTANNHCLDQGLEGLTATIDMLERLKIQHTGTYRTREESEALSILTVGDTKVAILSMTYGTNANQNGVYLDDTNDFCVDSFDRDVFIEQHEPLLLRCKHSIQKHIPEEVQINIKKKLGLTWGLPKKDRDVFPEKGVKDLQKSIDKIRRAKTEADVVIVCAHSGGQFNSEPGEYTGSVYKAFVEAGASAIVGNHPHIIQKMEYCKDVPVFYSLGNFCYSPDSCYIIPDEHPECSLLVHFDIADKRISGISYDILKVEQDKRGTLRSVCIGNSSGDVFEQEDALVQYINSRVGLK